MAGVRFLRLIFTVAALLAGTRLVFCESAPAALPPIPLWPGTPPGNTGPASPEIITRTGGFENVSIPAISVYLPPPGHRSGLALVICPGGGYHALDWHNHVVNAALYFIPRGIAVIGVKYRTNPPANITRNDRDIPLADLKRAMQIVRSHAAEWGIDPHQIGVVGYSAGANLAVTLAGRFDPAPPATGDAIARQSNRPDFVVGCATWHWQEKTSPFTFTKNTPPVFLVHATNDGQPAASGHIGGAPIELPRAIQAQLTAIGVPVQLDIYDVGAHGVGNLIPQRVERHFPPTNWPQHLLTWLASLDPKFKAAGAAALH